jgi:PAS domain S-box-containing protein
MTTEPSYLELFANGGEVGELLRKRDWQASQLGRPDAWPEVLRTTCRLILASRFPMFVAWRPDLLTIYNDAYIPVLGARHPKALCARFRDIWEEIWPELEPLVALAMKGEATYSENLPFCMWRNGHAEQTWFTFSFSPLRDETGSIVGMFCACTETTAQVVAEAKLRKLNETLEERVEATLKERDRIWLHSPDVLLIIGTDGILRSINPAGPAVLGYTEAEMVNQHFARFVHPDDVASTAEAIVYASTALLEHFEVRVRRKDGAYLWFSWSAMPGEDGIYANGRNVTSEKEQAEALARAEAALRQAHKMEAVGQLTGGIAHDFNNMLAGVVGQLEMMRVRIEQERFSELMPYVDTAEHVTDRATALTHRLLAFSRQQTLDPKVIDVNSLVLDTIELIQRSVGPDIQIRSALGAGARHTLCDPSQLASALLNLALNARDAMPDGGTLTLETVNMTLNAESPAVKEGADPGDYVTIKVTDTGVGMEPYVVSRAFDPFFTTKPIGQGTGLGLSMVFGFVKQTGGHVRILSEPGAGTTIKIHLPVCEGEVEREVPVNLLQPIAAITSRTTILLVDDEAPLRKVLAEKLNDLGYNVIQATDATEALRVIQSKRKIDLLVSDVGLPGNMNGRQLADVSKGFQKDLDVLLITGYAEKAALGNGVLGPNLQLMTKPFGLDAFAAKVSAMIQRKAA